MSTITPTSPDSELLALYIREDSESAFCQLVRRYERMVLSAAARKLGDFDLARDVAQRVFSALARKAFLLDGRASIAGWLYHAASLEATQFTRAEARRRHREETVAQLSVSGSPASDWSALEDAFNAIDRSEREALILRFYQDADYATMAATLGIREAAARKRVSRGLQSLGKQLRRRGIGSSATALLTAAVAFQSSTTVQAGLAAAALAQAGTISVPLILSVQAVASHTAAKIAASAAALLLVPLIFQEQATASARQELEMLRTRDRQAIAARTQSADERSVLMAKLEQARGESRATQLRAKELTSLKRRAADEVLVAMGSTEEMARKIATTLQVMFPDQAPRRPAGTSPGVFDPAAGAQQASQSLPEMLAAFRAIPELERSPVKAAHFYATLVGELSHLDAAARIPIEAAFRDWVAQMQAEGLAFPQRPKTDFQEWDQRRAAAMKEIVRKVAHLLPPSGDGKIDTNRVLLGIEDNPPFLWQLLGLNEGAR
jgi:RNA polymerase sigma factor (sigma-70 family)